jgi:hypothetical protein
MTVATSAFDRLFAAAGLGPLLDQFGVACTFVPRSGPARAVVAVIEYVREEDRQGEAQEHQKERCWITVFRNEAAARGGIAVIQRGDAFEGPEDTTSTRWSFAGQVRSRSAEAWDLLFERVRPTRVGPRTGGG